MDRFSLTDAQWAKMQQFCLGKPTDLDGQVATADCSRKLSYGSREQAALGVICLRCLASGIRCSSAFATG